MTRHTLLFSLIITCMIKGVKSSECSRLAEINGIQGLSLCQSTASRTTARGIVFDFYDGDYTNANTCTCSINIQATSNFTLSMTPYEGLGINSNSGCGSEIRVLSTRSGQLKMECSVLGTLNVMAGDNITLKLSLEPDGDSRHCMLMTASPYQITADCHAIESPTTIMTTSAMTTSKTSTTKPVTSTKMEQTTTMTTPATMKSTATTPKTTKSTTTTVTTTTDTTIMTNATSIFSSSSFPTTKSTVVPSTTSMEETSKPPTFIFNPTTNIQTTTLPVTNATSSTTSSQTMSSNRTSYTGTTEQPTSSSTKAGGGPMTGEQRSGGISDDILIIIIPVGLGVPAIFVFVAVVAHFVRAQHKKHKPGPETDTQKHSRNLTNDEVFHYQNEMAEQAKYDDTDDLHSHSDRFGRFKNPVYINVDDIYDDYVPDIPDQEVTHFTAMHNTESEKITTLGLKNGEEDGNEEPWYAVVN